MNPYTPLEIFLPPTGNERYDNIHLLLAANWDGLNSGVMGFRIHPWTVSILSAVAAYPIFESERVKTDRFRDQSAFAWLLQDPGSPLAKTAKKGRENWATVPMRWFNSLPVNNAFAKNGTWLFGQNMTQETFDEGTTKILDDGHKPVVQPWKVMKGDMIVHFAGTSRVRDSWMGGWLDRCEEYSPEWANFSTQVELAKQAEQFYKNLPNQWAWEAQRAEEKIQKDRLRLELERKKKADSVKEEAKKKQAEEATKKKEEEERKKKEEEDKKKKEEEDKKKQEEEERKKQEAQAQKKHDEAEKPAEQKAEAAPAPQTVAPGEQKPASTNGTPKQTVNSGAQATPTAAPAPGGPPP